MRDLVGNTYIPPAPGPTPSGTIVTQQTPTGTQQSTMISGILQPIKKSS